MREAIIEYMDGHTETVRVQGTAEVPEIKWTPDIKQITYIGVSGDFLLFINKT